MSAARAYRSNKRMTLAVLAIMCALIGLVLLAALGVMTLECAITLGVGLLTLYLLASASECALWILFCVGVASVMFGHRSKYLGYWTYVVALQVIVYLLFARTLFDRDLRSKRALGELPIMLVAVCVWSWLHGLVFWMLGTHWDNVLSWSLPLTLGFPMSFVVRRFVTQENRLITLLRILLWVSVFVSALGIIEFYIPGVLRLAPKFFGESYSTPEGFQRAAFGFWGYSSAAILCSFGMLIAYYEIACAKSSRALWLAWPALTLNGVAVYISGQRASWVGLTVGVVVIAVLSGGRAKLLGLALALTMLALPGAFWQRVTTMSAMFDPSATHDSSLLGRFDRWTWGWEAMLGSPIIGVGYGHWQTHNVLLEIGSTLGVLPALLFAFFIAQLLLRVVRLALRASILETKGYGALFLALTLNSVEQVLVETFLFTPPFAAPQWMILALAWYLPGILKSEDRPSMVPTRRMLA